ncbi:MAG: RnfABCDGE type electron transport complex subunit D [Bacilli bacterium]|jgi:electron transport complex protein RnfD
MKFIVQPPPFTRRKRSTTGIMYELSALLGLLWVAAIVYNFTIAPSYGLKAILMVVVAVVTTLICDVLVGAIAYRDKEKPFGPYLFTRVKENYSLVTALIFALSLPIGTPYYVIIIGSLFATLIVKYAFGGFGANIFNPAVFGRIFVTFAFGSQLKAFIGTVPGNVSSLTDVGVTVTASFSSLGVKWISDSLAALNVTMGQLWLGNYSGAIGETFTGLILLLGLYMIVRKICNWRPMVAYLLTVTLTALVVALIAGLNPGTYILLHLAMGGLMFGAVFMITDPVTSPTSMFGKVLIGVIAGLMTVLIRIQGGYPEGVSFAIAIANLVSPLIDRFATGMTNNNNYKKWSIIISVLLLSLALNGGLAYYNTQVRNPEPEESQLALNLPYEAPAEEPQTDYVVEVIE